VAWSAPIAAVAYAAPAFAASQPLSVTQCGTACKHPGNSNEKRYHFTFCFQTNNALFNNIVNIGNMTVNGVTRDAKPDTVTVFTGQPTCIFVDAPSFENSANGTGFLEVSYATADEPGTLITDTISLTVNAEKDLPPCGTGADPGGNPGWPHTPQGDATHVPTNCVT
jgi:hypothetical protein